MSFVMHTGSHGIPVLHVYIVLALYCFFMSNIINNIFA